MNSDYSAIGLTHLFNIMITLGCIGFSWWILQAVRVDVFVKNPSSLQAKLLQVVLAVISGYLLGQFFIDYAYWASNLKWIF